MKTKIFAILLLCSFCQISFAQQTKSTKLALKSSEPVNIWSLNLSFSDHGFGVGGTYFKNFSKNVSGNVSLLFSGAKDDREFESFDIFGNSFTPYKVNRLFMAQLSIGPQIRLFREDVTDELRPTIQFGLAPTAIIYTPYDKSFFPSFKYAKAKYTVGGYAGFGVDYLTSRTSSLTLNFRYYYVRLFGQGVNSLSTSELKSFNTISLLFGFNFMH